PTAPCLGVLQELTAEPGNLCAVRNAGTPVEANDKGVEREPASAGLKFRDNVGNEIKSGGSTEALGSPATKGVNLVFQSKQWNLTGTATLTEAVMIQAAGVFSVTAP